MKLACLLCLNIETSLIAKHFLVLFLLLTFISNGEILINFRLVNILDNIFI